MGHLSGDFFPVAVKVLVHRHDLDALQLDPAFEVAQRRAATSEADALPVDDQIKTVTAFALARDSHLEFNCHVS
jgi:hypothetical protein